LKRRRIVVTLWDVFQCGADLKFAIANRQVRNKDVQYP